MHQDNLPGRRSKSGHERGCQGGSRPRGRGHTARMIVRIEAKARLALHTAGSGRSRAPPVARAPPVEYSTVAECAERRVVTALASPSRVFTAPLLSVLSRSRLVLTA
eukprot:1123719-Prymnesium_polylepis.1